MTDIPNENAVEAKDDGVNNGNSSEEFMAKAMAAIGAASSTTSEAPSELIPSQDSISANSNPLPLLFGSLSSCSSPINVDEVVGRQSQKLPSPPTTHENSPGLQPERFGSRLSRQTKPLTSNETQNVDSGEQSPAVGLPRLSNLSNSPPSNELDDPQPLPLRKSPSPPMTEEKNSPKQSFPVGLPRLSNLSNAAPSNELDDPQPLPLTESSSPEMTEEKNVPKPSSPVGLPRLSNLSNAPPPNELDDPQPVPSRKSPTPPMTEEKNVPKQASPLGLPRPTNISSAPPSLGSDDIPSGKSTPPPNDTPEDPTKSTLWNIQRTETTNDPSCTATAQRQSMDTSTGYNTVDLDEEKENWDESDESDMMGLPTPVVKRSLSPAQANSIDRISFEDLVVQIENGLEITREIIKMMHTFVKLQTPDKYCVDPPKSESTSEFMRITRGLHSMCDHTIESERHLMKSMNKEIKQLKSNLKQFEQEAQALKLTHVYALKKLQKRIKSMNKAMKNADYSAGRVRMIQDRADDKHKHKVADAMYKTKTKLKKQGFFSKKINNEDDDENVNAAVNKAEADQQHYITTVMSANYQQKQLYELEDRLKWELKELWQNQMRVCKSSMGMFVTVHSNFFGTKVNNIRSVQSDILSGLSELDPKEEFEKMMQINAIKVGNSVIRARENKLQVKQHVYQNVWRSLQDAMDITRILLPDKNVKIPLILTTLCETVIDLKGFETEGIFRKSAKHSEVDQIKERLSQNEYSLDIKDPHVAACVLKDWLRGLRDSIIPESVYEMGIEMAKSNAVNNESVEVFLSQLPEINRETIKYLVRFLHDLIVEENQLKTKMTLKNVAIVFAPTIMKCPSTDAATVMSNAEHEQRFVSNLIDKWPSEELARKSSMKRKLSLKSNTRASLSLGGLRI